MRVEICYTKSYKIRMFRNGGKSMRKKVLVVTGMMLALFMVAPVTNNSVIDGMIGIETVYAAETYSDNWKMDETGTWWYYMEDGSVAKDCWVHDHGQWYLLGTDGAMRTGVFKSNGGKYYLLDTVRGTGYYGKLLTNGMVYNGVVLQCDTSEAYEGALSQETINALQSIGLDFGSAPSVENTKHVENGKVTSGGSSVATENNNQNATSNQKPDNVDANEYYKEFDLEHATSGNIVPKEYQENFIKNRD